MRSVLFFITLFALGGCKQPPLDKNFEALIRNYKIGYFEDPDENVLVICSDCKEQMSGLVYKKIKQVGFNERFIILERVGKGGWTSQSSDSLTISYYIIDMDKRPDVDNRDYLFGPVDFEDFKSRKKELGIDDLIFTKEYSVN